VKSTTSIPERYHWSVRCYHGSGKIPIMKAFGELFLRRIPLSRIAIRIGSNKLKKMRKWYKYLLDKSRKGKLELSIDQDFKDHEKAMCGYKADDAYCSKESFFNKYFWNYHYGRLECYDNFMRRHLKKGEDVLSIASGRCANELFLIEDGYKITCSDLKVFDAYQETKKLFPQFEFVEHDILNTPLYSKYDTVICLSLIYLFNEEKLLAFFRNVSDSLKTGGHLILDFVGSPDNVLSFLLHDIYLKYEMKIARAAKFLLIGQLPGLVVKHHGYRRTDEEIISAARKSGFELLSQENYAFVTEFRRSYIFDKLVKQTSFIEKAFGIIGRNIPYIRMGHFLKLSA